MEARATRKSVGEEGVCAIEEVADSEEDGQDGDEGGGAPKGLDALL